MTLPPERITVKRRRDEDPVEALFIQSKKQRPSAVWTLEDPGNYAPQPAVPPIVVPSEQGLASQPTVPKFSAPLPTVLPTTTTAVAAQPDKTVLFENLKGESKENTATCSTTTAPAAAARPTVPYDEGEIFRAADPRLRKFHLSRDSEPGLKRQASFTAGIKKQKKLNRETVAVFIEKRKRFVEASDLAQEQEGVSGHQGQSRDLKDSLISAGTPTRRRPNISAAEKVWRVETWGKSEGHEANERGQNAYQHFTNWDSTSIGLAEELQEFSMQEVRAQAGRLQDTATPQLKFKPKPPKPRRPWDDADFEPKIIDPPMFGILDGDGDYIVDTYIRSSLQPLSIGDSFQPHIDPLRGLDSSKVGMLVIEEEEEAFWETFVDEQESETEMSSDEEDENAEDFYGNDYPEEEVDVDDEYYSSTYKHRNDASDDERYEYDVPEQSDDEGQPHRRWN